MDTNSGVFLISVFILVLFFILALVTSPRTEVFESSISPKRLLSWDIFQNNNLMLGGFQTHMIIAVNPNKGEDINIAVLIVRRNDNKLIGYSYIEDGNLVSYIYNKDLGYIKNNGSLNNDQQELRKYLNNLDIVLFKKEWSSCL